MNDGGPAFPEHHYFDPGRGQYGMHMTASDVGCGGMSLRDWFAGMAMQGQLAACAVGYEYTGSDARLKCAIEAYQHADAMLVARERKESA